MEKNCLIRKKLLNLWHHKLGSKSLQYMLFLRYEEVNTIRQWNLVSYRIYVRNIFLEKSFTKCEQVLPGPFLKNRHWAYLWINSLKFYLVCFYCMASWGLLIIWKLSCRPFVFTSNRNFLKTKRGLELVPPVTVSAWFLKKNISFVIFC